MYSSSFADPACARLEALVRESFDVLVAELPDYHGAMCSCLAGKAVQLNIDGESFCIDFERERAWFRATIPQLAVRTDSRTILDTVDGRIDVYSALLADRLAVRGALDDVVALQAALSAYLNGALRCSGFPRLLSRLRELESDNRAAEDQR